MKNLVLKKSSAGLLILGLLSVSALPVWSAPAKPAASEAATTGVAAEVNNEKISLADLTRLMDYYKKVDPRFAANTPEAKKKLATLQSLKLDGLIEERLLAQEARRQGIKADEAKVDANVAELRKPFKTDAEFQQWLKEDGQTPESFKAMIADQLALDALSEKITAGIKVTDDDVRSYYRSNIKQFSFSEGLTGRHILLAVNANAPASEKERVKARATALMKTIKNEKDFIAAAKNNSDDTANSAKGGELGTFSRGVAAKSFEDAAFSAPLNKVVGPVTTKSGYHLIFITEKIPSRAIPVETVLKDPEVRAQLFQLKIKEKLDATIASLKAKAKIKKYV